MNTHPMPGRFGKRRSFLKVGLEELMSEVLSEESEHQTGSLRIGNESPSQQDLLNHVFGVGQRGRWRRAVFGQRGQGAGVVGRVGVCLPAFIAVVGVVSRRAFY